MTDDRICREEDPVVIESASDQVADVVQELTEWMMEVADGERFVDVGFVIVIRDGRIVRKKRIHESVE